ncbi:MAG: hypothetical protein P8Y72_12425, partial [Anaerolineales bacterium]
MTCKAHFLKCVLGQREVKNDLESTRMPKFIHDWENPQIFQVNTRPPHASTSYHPNRESALQGKL